MTLLTASIIATRPDVLTQVAGPDDNGKYMGMVCLGEENYCRPLLSTPYEFDTTKEATDGMETIIEAVRKIYAETVNV